MIALCNGRSREALGKRWGNSGDSQIHLSPAHALSRAVALEDQQAAHLVAIQILDRVVQALFGILLRLVGEGIVNREWPVFFFKGSEDKFLMALR
jgi:hypothetical protein